MRSYSLAKRRTRWTSSAKAAALFLLVLTLGAEHAAAQQPSGSHATSQKRWSELTTDDERAAALTAALAATGNHYPAPAVFVKRWNLLAEALPAAQITTFTVHGRENGSHPIAQLDQMDFSRADSVSFPLDAPDRSIEYVVHIDDPERSGAYILTVGDRQTKIFGQYCLWTIRSTRSAFTIHLAIQLFANAVDNGKKPAGKGATAEAEGTILKLKKDQRDEICEVRKAEGD
jgi:hypothetical protein